MSQVQHDTSDDTTARAIVAALRDCYGDLEAPGFRKVQARLDGDSSRRLIEMLRSDGIAINDTTDRNDDVSIQLVLDNQGDQVGLGLSGVGPFATLLHQDTKGRYHRVTRSESAPAPLAAHIATALEHADLTLLDRKTVTRTIRRSMLEARRRQRFIRLSSRTRTGFRKDEGRPRAIRAREKTVSYDMRIAK